jgi:hypothetical protein
MVPRRTDATDVCRGAHNGETLPTRLPYLTERPRKVASQNLPGDARRITALKKTVRDDFAAVWHVEPYHI